MKHRSPRTNVNFPQVPVNVKTDDCTSSYRVALAVISEVSCSPTYLFPPDDLVLSEPVFQDTTPQEADRTASLLRV